MLCVDPETMLPFMVNMGLKMADFADLDDRPRGPDGQHLSVQQEEYSDSASKLSGRGPEGGLASMVDPEMARSPLLDPRNYPFYYKVKRNLYIIQQLLEDSASGDQNEEIDSSEKKIHRRGQASCFESTNEAIKWAFRNNPNAEAFRRSMLPFYLLKEDKDYKHPRYIEHSNLAQNLCEKTSVEIIITISLDLRKALKNFVDGAERANKDSIMRRHTIKAAKAGTTSQPAVYDADFQIVIPNFYLLKTAKTLIDEATERVHDLLMAREGQNSTKHHFGMTRNAFKSVHSDGTFHRRIHHSILMEGVKVLKFRNEEAYVYGDTQLIYFSDVRDCIKRGEAIELVLMNADQYHENSRDQNNEHGE